MKTNCDTILRTALTREYTREVWLETIQILTDKLSEFTRLHFSMGPAEKITLQVSKVDPGFCVDLHSISNDVLKITTIARLGAERIAVDATDADRFHVSAYLFLFSDDKRLVGKNADYVFLEYVLENEKPGYWNSNGWSVDEFGEFEGVEH